MATERFNVQECLVPYYDPRMIAVSLAILLHFIHHLISFFVKFGGGYFFPLCWLFNRCQVRIW